MYRAPLLDRVWSKIVNLAGFTSKFIGTDRARLHILEGAGKGQLPTIVFVHGIGANAASFALAMHQLKADFRHLIAIDLPGHGLSPPLAVAQDHMSTFAEAAATLRLYLNEPIYIYGNSLGGAFALAFAERFPELVLGVILSSPVGAPMDQAELADFVQRLSFSTLRQAREFAAKLTDRMPMIVAWIMAPFIRNIFANVTIRTILSRFSPEHRVDPQQLAALKMPLSMLWGKEDRLMPNGQFEYFLKHLPAHAQVLRPSGFSHCPHLDHPTRVALSIRTFAKQATQMSLNEAA